MPRVRKVGRGGINHALYNLPHNRAGKPGYWDTNLVDVPAIAFWEQACKKREPIGNPNRQKKGENPRNIGSVRIRMVVQVTNFGEQVHKSWVWKKNDLGAFTVVKTPWERRKEKPNRPNEPPSVLLSS